MRLCDFVLQRALAASRIQGEFYSTVLVLDRLGILIVFSDLQVAVGISFFKLFLSCINTVSRLSPPLTSVLTPPSFRNELHHHHQSCRNSRFHLDFCPCCASPYVKAEMHSTHVQLIDPVVVFAKKWWAMTADVL